MMKKSPLLSLAAFLLSGLMLLSSCSEQDPLAPDGYQTASNDNVDYSLFVPENWIVDTADNSLVTAARATEYENANISMMVYDNDSYAAETTAEGEEVSLVLRYWADNLTALSNLFDKDAEGNSTFKLETDGARTLMGKTADGKDVGAFSYVYTGTIGGVELKYMQVLACHNNCFYFFTYTANAASYDEYIETVNEILGYIVLD